MLGSYWNKARQIGQAVKEVGKKSVPGKGRWCF
jgi:hypothetical protein